MHQKKWFKKPIPFVESLFDINSCSIPIILMEEFIKKIRAGKKIIFF